MSNDLGGGPSPKGGKEVNLKKFWKKIIRKEDSQQLEEEVMSMLEAGQESGILKEEGKKMINSIFAFDDKLAYEIMTPRTDVFVIDIDDPPEEYLNDLMTMRYSRIPVCKGETDNIIGILHIKDYLIQAWEKGFDGVEIASIIRKAYFVPETMPLQALLEHFIKHRSYIAVVIDEFGGTAGVISLEDVLEQIFGEIEDEHDIPDLTEKQVGQDEYVLSCRLEVKYLNEKYGLGIEESKEYDTLAGFIIFNYDGIPTAGETVFIGGLQLRILRTTRSRIELARVKKL